MAQEFTKQQMESKFQMDEQLLINNHQQKQQQSQQLMQTQIEDDQLVQYEEETKQQQSQQPEEFQPLESYTFLKTLGKGNFGKVKLALHKLTNEKVAIKILEKDLIFQNSDIVRISRQLKIMKKLRHPFVVQLYEIIQTTKELYLVMEYAEGGDLFDKIVNQERIKENDAARIYSQIALGMEYFHDKGVTHRDLKPENILLSKDGTIKIADFGLGNMFKPDEKLKTACGSPCYASPQMLNREPYDPKKIDIWSTGIIMYAMVCGYLPFEDQVTSKLYEKIKTANIKLPSGISSICRNLIRGLLAKDPKQRLDIEAIVSHQMLFPHVQQLKQLIKQRQLTENKIQEICEMYDIEEKQKLISDLNKNRHNNLTTLYFLAVKRLERLDQEEEEEQEDFLGQQNLNVKQNKPNQAVQQMEQNQSLQNVQQAQQISQQTDIQTFFPENISQNILPTEDQNIQENFDAKKIPETIIGNECTHIEQQSQSDKNNEYVQKHVSLNQSQHSHQQQYTQMQPQAIVNVVDEKTLDMDLAVNAQESLQKKKIQEQTPNESELIKESYQLSMEIEQTLSQLNKINQANKINQIQSKSEKSLKSGQEEKMKGNSQILESQIPDFQISGQKQIQQQITHNQIQTQIQEDKISPQQGIQVSQATEIAEQKNHEILNKDKNLTMQIQNVEQVLPAQLIKPHAQRNDIQFQQSALPAQNCKNQQQKQLQQGHVFIQKQDENRKYLQVSVEHTEKHQHQESLFPEIVYIESLNIENMNKPDDDDKQKLILQQDLFQNHQETLKTPLIQQQQPSDPTENKSVEIIQSNQKIQTKLIRQPHVNQLLFSTGNLAQTEKKPELQLSNYQITNSNGQNRQKTLDQSTEKGNLNKKQRQGIIQNRNIRFNERSHSKDSPIVFKSNKNHNPNIKNEKKKQTQQQQTILAMKRNQQKATKQPVKSTRQKYSIARDNKKKQQISQPQKPTPNSNKSKQQSTPTKIVQSKNSTKKPTQIIPIKANQQNTLKQKDKISTNKPTLKKLQQNNITSKNEIVQVNEEDIIQRKSQKVTSGKKSNQDSWKVLNYTNKFKKSWNASQIRMKNQNQLTVKNNTNKKVQNDLENNKQHNSPELDQIHVNSSRTQRTQPGYKNFSNHISKFGTYKPYNPTKNAKLPAFVTKQVNTNKNLKSHSSKLNISNNDKKASGRTQKNVNSSHSNTLTQFFNGSSISSFQPKQYESFNKTISNFNLGKSSPSRNKQKTPKGIDDYQNEQYSQNGNHNKSGLLSIIYSETQPELVNPELILFASCSQLSQILDQMHSTSPQLGSSIKGSLTIYEYPHKDYIYVQKSDLSKSQMNVRHSFSKQSSIVSSQSNQSFLRTKVSSMDSFEFVKFINSIILSESDC